MEFLEKNGRKIIVAFVCLILVGVVLTFSSTYTKHKEEKAQEKLAQIEMDYTKYKEEMAASSRPMPPADPKIKDKPVDTRAESAAKAVTMRGALITNLNQYLTSEKSKNIASRIAALYLSELYIDEGKTSEALNTLKNADATGKDLTSILVQKKIGALLSDNNQCDEALKVWERVIEMPAAQFAQGEIKIMQSLCYQKKNDLKKAEEILMSIKNDKSENMVEYVRNADRILRLIQFKKASGS